MCIHFWMLLLFIYLLLCRFLLPKKKPMNEQSSRTRGILTTRLERLLPAIIEIKCSPHLFNSSTPKSEQTKIQKPFVHTGLPVAASSVSFLFTFLFTLGRQEVPCRTSCVHRFRCFLTLQSFYLGQSVDLLIFLRFLFKTQMMNEQNLNLPIQLEVSNNNDCFFLLSFIGFCIRLL